jgi:hypothetical protein
VSLLLFASASVVAFTIITNAFGADEYATVAAEARVAAALLASDGFPTTWTNESVVRAGLLSSERLSLRKAHDLAAFSRSRLRTSLRLSDDVLLYVTNATNDTIPIFGTCIATSASSGQIVVTSTDGNRSLRAASVSDADHLLADHLLANHAIMVDTFTVDAAAADGLRAYDLVIIQGNLSVNQTSDAARSTIIRAARAGITIVIIGDPGAELLGARWDHTTAQDSDILTDDLPLPALDLGTPGAASIAGGTFGAGVPVVHLNTTLGVVAPITIATTADGNTSAAVWLYDGARVWYLAGMDGQLANGTMIAAALGASLEDLLFIPWPVCGAVPAPDADQVAVHRRTMVWHDEPLTLNVIVWRDR